jgi:hypothetical protein
MLKLSPRSLALMLLVLGALAYAMFAFTQSKHATAPARVDSAAVVAKPEINTMYTSGAAPDRRAFSAAEEAYSVNLWKIHDKVKTSAVQLSFAGLSYKLKELDRAGVKAKVSPQIEIFANAQNELGKIAVPDSLKALHGDYVNAVNFYRDAAQDMVKIANDSNEQHLLDAHSKSNQAATLLLKVGAELWPGEFKPN